MKTVAISGGGQGIGRALALAFARRGYKVSIADLDKEAGLETIKRIRHIGGNGMFVYADVAHEEDVARWMQLIQADMDGADVLINNAGIERSGPMLSLPIDEFDRVMAVNVRGAFLCAQQAANQMHAKGGGSIIQIASTRALMSEPGTEAYSASKGALLALTHAMAVSLGQYGIRVNAVSPGWIETGEWLHGSRAYTPQHSDRDRLQHPVGRVGRPEDIAEACLFLAGERAGFITGQNVVIDGGMTVKMIYA